MPRSHRRIPATLALTATLTLVVAQAAQASNPTTVRVNQHGSTEADADSALPVVSANGQFVAYESGQTQPGGAGADGDDVFWWNRTTGVTKLVSHGRNGQKPDGISFGANISSDGRYVSFESEATNLIASDGNGVSDAFVWDSKSGKITAASVNDSGDLGNGDSGDVSMSPNGRYVAFSTGSTNLGGGDNNIYDDVYVRDTTAHKTYRASVAVSGHKVDGNSIETCMSNTGVVGFGSNSNFIVSAPQPDPAINEVYVRDIVHHTTQEASVSNGGDPGEMNSFNCDISANGRYIAFDSFSGNLSTKDGDPSDIFVRDVQAGKTYLASVGMNGTHADNDSSFPAVSDNGRFVAFESDATNLIANDGNHVQDVFRYDRTAKTTKRLSVATGGTAGNQTSYYPELSGDGTWTVFTSNADNLAPNDGNHQDDVFERGPLSN